MSAITFLTCVNAYMVSNASSRPKPLALVPPNADPDGYDPERSDLDGIDIGEVEPSKRAGGA